MFVSNRPIDRFDVLGLDVGGAAAGGALMVILGGAAGTALLDPGFGTICGIMAGALLDGYIKKFDQAFGPDGYYR